MIGKLTGIVDLIAHDHLIINVGGVGYIAFCPLSVLSKVTLGETISLFIETHVREDHIHLFGFLSSQEKNAFLTLTTVKGVGNKLALTILSATDVNRLNVAIAAGDKAVFKAISGVGPKLAERIVNELKDKVADGLDQAKISILSTSASSVASDISSDAISALTNLGIGRSDAYNNVNKILAEHPNIDIGELIRLSLKQMAK